MLDPPPELPLLPLYGLVPDPVLVDLLGWLVLGWLVLGLLVVDTDGLV